MNIAKLTSLKLVILIFKRENELEVAHLTIRSIEKTSYFSANTWKTFTTNCFFFKRTPFSVCPLE